MEFWRLFTAVRPDLHVLEELVRTQQQFRRHTQSDPVRWVKRDNLHITLQFLGNTPVDRVHDVTAAMDRAAAARPGVLRLEVGEIRGFPSTSRPRVVVTSIQDAGGGLTRLQQTLSAELETRGFTPERRRYQPHITLGYVKKRARADELQEIRAALRVTGESNTGGATPVAGTGAALFFNAEEIVLIRSTLSPGGSVYEVIHSASLSSASNATSSGESARE